MGQMKRACAIAVLALTLLAGFSAADQDSRAEIVNLRSYTHPNFTRIVVDIGTLREYTSGEIQDQGRIYVDVLQASLNPLLQDKTISIKTEYLSQINIAQKSPTAVRVSVDIDFARVESYRIYHLFDPFRIVIDIYPKLANKTAPAPGTTPEKTVPPVKDAPPPAKTPDPSAAGYSMIRQLGLGVRTIVLDPGHGGTDPGCIGRSGAQEKAVTLQIALALKKVLIEKYGFDVILTRETDVFIPLEDRTVIANQKRADLYISIHANASPNRKRTGIETFYLNFSPEPAVNELAARENATSAKNISQMKTIIQKIVLNSKFEESRDLAEKIHRNMIQYLSKKYGAMNSLGVKGGPFWVLIGGEMPSILVEVSHLSNSREEALLKTAPYQASIVQGICNGIMEYIRSLGKG